ncbi:MAG: hypothetical protein RDV41_05330 [Planctomycetota bacterium]|nr:hypothetical protein [Planctomycetota bacterium]
MRISSPRRPLARFIRSPESASFWSSSITNRGTTTGTSMRCVAIMSAMRPSIAALVSTTMGLPALPSRANSTKGITNLKSSFVRMIAMTAR